MLLPDLCIGARDEVVSVVLVSAVAPALLDGAPSSLPRNRQADATCCASSSNAAIGVRPRYRDEARPLERALRGDPTLLIGDSRDRRASSAFRPRDVYDLGQLWHEWTGRQTVFAVWAARRDAYERDPPSVRDCMHALTDAYTWSRSQRRSRRARAARDPAPRRLLRSYYGKLNFSSTSPRSTASRAFCRELVAIGAIAATALVSGERRCRR